MAALLAAKSLCHMQSFPHESGHALHTPAWKDIKSPTGIKVPLN